MEAFSCAPRLVGRNNIERASYDDSYALLLERARADHLTRAASRGAYASRWGRQTPPTPLSFFLRPSQPADAYSEAGLSLWASLGEAGPARALQSPAELAAQSALAASYEAAGSVLTQWV